MDFVSITWCVIVHMVYNTYNWLLFLLLLLFHLLMNLVSLCCWIWSKIKKKKKNTTFTRSLSSYDFKTMKTERKKERNWHNKNRFCDKIRYLLCHIMYNTYDELSSLFSCQIGSQYVVGRVLVGGTKKKGNNTSMMSSSSSSSCLMMNLYNTGSFLLCAGVWVCV